MIRSLEKTVQGTAGWSAHSEFENSHYSFKNEEMVSGLAA